MKDNRTKRVTFRVTEEEYKKLEELAYGSCRLLSVYCRDCVFGRKIIVIPGVDAAIRQLRHIGNNLNQLTKLSHQTGFYRTKKVVMELLEKLKSIMNDYKAEERRCR